MGESGGTSRPQASKKQSLSLLFVGKQPEVAINLEIWGAQACWSTVKGGALHLINKVEENPRRGGGESTLQRGERFAKESGDPNSFPTALRQDRHETKERHVKDKSRCSGIMLERK